MPRYQPTPEQLARLQAAREAYYADPANKVQQRVVMRKAANRRKRINGKFAPNKKPGTQPG